MSRGRQPVDTDQEALLRKYKRDFEEIMLNRDEVQLREFLIALGQEEGSERFELSLKGWKSYREKLYFSTAL